MKMDAYFQGVWRMDWGFGNPNKTAALIAMLMVAVWGLAWFRRWGFWAALALFTALGVGLIRTMSRGGVLALCAGLTVLVWNLPRPWSRRRVGAVILAVWVMVGAAVFWEAHARFGQGFVETDRSIANRIELWKVAPRMMRDAPGGWGWGNAGRAYMQWYQPADRVEEYRTLVNSHLTWLVELGWPLRFIVLLGDLTVLVLCWPRFGAWASAIPLGVWVAFGVAAAFSSIAESPWLWATPGLALAFALGGRIRDRRWPRARTWVLAGGCAAFGIGVLCLWGGSASEVRLRGRQVLLGNATPSAWIVADPKVMGRTYGKALRTARSDGKGVAIGIVEAVDDVGDVDGKLLVIGGQRSGREVAWLKAAAEKAGRILLLNPSFGPAEIGAEEGALRGRIEVIFGEFSAALFAGAWEAVAPVRRVEGAGDFLPSWADFVVAVHRDMGVVD